MTSETARGSLVLAGAAGGKPSGRLPHETSELVRDGGATERDALALGAFLEEVQYLGPARQASVNLVREKEMSHGAPTYRGTVVVADGASNDDAIVGHAH